MYNLRNHLPGKGTLMWQHSVFKRAEVQSSSTHPYQHTYGLLKQFQEIESKAFFDEISEHARLVQHAQHFELLACFTPGKDMKNVDNAEMENNSNFGQFGPYFHVLDRDDNLDNTVM